MFRRWLTWALCALVAFVVCALGISWAKGSAPPTHRVQPGNLIVIAMPGLTWSDINSESMPATTELAHHSAVGNQLVRAIGAHSCSTSAWATLGSGTRTPLGYTPPAAPTSGINDYCPPVPQGKRQPDGSYFFPQWRAWSKTARERKNLPSTLGLVSSTLERHGQCVSAVGAPAALGAANEQGRVTHFYPIISDADFSACPVTLVSASRDDANVRAVVEKAPPETTFVVTGLTDDERPESPRAIMVRGPNVKSGLLRSRSTRQPGLVQTTDVSAFILSRVSPAPVLGEGRPLSVEAHSPPSALKSVADTQRLLRIEHNLVAPFFTWAAIVAVIMTLIGLWLWRETKIMPTRHINALHRGWWQFTAALGASLPVSTFLANLLPWYMQSHPLVMFAASTLAFAIPLTVVALVGPWRRWTPGPAAFMAATTALVLGMDVVQGAPLQLVSMLGLQPVYGGRFFGMGNVGYSLFMTAATLCAALLAGRFRALKRPRLAMLTVLAIGVPALLANGVPQWGNEGGGSAAFIPALVYLTLRARGMRITLTRMVIAAVGGVLFTTAFAWLDYLRGPAARTHLGDIFAGLIGEGQTNPFQRVLIANWTMLNSNKWFWSIPLLMLACAVVVAMPEGAGRVLKPLFVRVPMLRHGLIAVVIMWICGFMANDSGTSIPVAGFLVAGPLVVLIGARMASPSTREAPPEELMNRHPASATSRAVAATAQQPAN